MREVDNDRHLTILEDDDWPEDELKSPEHKVLTKPVMRCLKWVTKYTKKVMEKSLYFRSNATFDDIVTFSRESAIGGNGDAFKGMSKSGHAPHKLFGFKAPLFNDDTIERPGLHKEQNALSSHTRYQGSSKIPQSVRLTLNGQALWLHASGRV